ncbi:MAG TPA: phosphatase PAP2 family protein [Oscillibacter sp.]|nr:phosphatase PAP2 family protein [Oscillibacter sp.]
MAFDWGILHWIQNTIACPFLDAVVPKLTMLGNAGIIWILAGLALLCSKKYRRQGALVLMGLLAGLLVGNIVLKNLVARPRPCWLDPSVRLLIASPTDYSFPSGHTLSSTIAATILTKTDRRFGYAAIPLAVLIALSRLYLYVHFPSDVLIAALLGLLISELTFRYGGRLLDKLPHKIA